MSQVWNMASISWATSAEWLQLPEGRKYGETVIGIMGNSDMMHEW